MKFLRSNWFSVFVLLYLVVATFVVYIKGVDSFSSESLIISFVGILATFVVVSNYAQVKAIEDKFNSKLEEMEQKFNNQREGMQAEFSDKILVFNKFSHTENGYEHPIDKSFRLAHWETNIEWSDVVAEHSKKWQDEMKSNYDRLMVLLDDFQKEKLKNSQQVWEESLKKDKDLFAAISKVKGERVIISSIAFMNRVRERALELNEFVSSFCIIQQ